MSSTAQPAPPLRLRPADGGPGLELASPRLIIAGYTGRDAEAVAAHIAELATVGVPAPPTVPAFYELDPALLTTGPVIETGGAVTSGEVEPVLIRHAGGYYLGVGSDHTDRELERRDIAAAKAACPKPIGPQVIALTPGLDWDTITIEAHVDGRVYQHGTLADLRNPADLLERLEGALGAIGEDLVVYAGTLPLLDGQFRPGRNWQVSLTTASGTRLTHGYEVKRRCA